MKFSCGITSDERYNRLRSQHKALQQWHDYFLWLPRTIEEVAGKKICYWLTTVERRADPEQSVFLHIYHGPGWQYRVKDSAQVK
jgi:hypothetical protein